MKHYFFLLLLFIFSNSNFAQKLSPEAQISLLTCTPGEELYAKFGHTAIRVFDPAQQTDIVFNYGLFNFYSENFYGRFIKGETDYQLGINHTLSFNDDYTERKRIIYEQKLNLSSEQKESIFEALMKNYRPENRIYRYNFVFDNCATRPYYILKSNITDSLKTPEFNKRTNTYRECIDYYTGEYSWAKFGINLIFGKDADRIMKPEERLFLPEELMIFLSEATTANAEKIVTAEHVAPFIIKKNNPFLSPFAVVILLLSLIYGISYIDFKRNTISYWLDATLFFTYGLIGLITCYLSFISVHPLVQNNFNIFFLNPLMFIPFSLLLFSKGRKWFLHGKNIWIIYFAISIVIRLFSGQAQHLFMGIILGHLIRLYFMQKPNRSQGIKLGKPLLIILLLIASINLKAQNIPPRLVVKILVDNLSHEGLTTMAPHFNHGGLRILQKEAAYIPHIYFPHSVNGGIESVATIVTGTTPYYHGVSDSFYFDRPDQKLYKILEDISQKGIGTEENLSAKNLLASSVTDELRMSNRNKNKVYAIGIDAEETIILGGHHANAVAWIDDNEMRWASTSYYSEGLSSYADDMNISGRFEQIAAKEWTPRFSHQDLYLFPTDKEIKDKGFAYKCNQTTSRKSEQKILKKTPAANALVIELALQTQEKEELGKDIYTDMLLLQLTTQTPSSSGSSINSAEQEDMYIQLNQDIGFLIEQLTKRIEKEQLLIMVIGNPKTSTSKEELDNCNIPNGYFNTERAASLINTYLMAIYGHERWIEGGYNNQIFLNRRLIEQKKMHLIEIQKQVANFIMEFEGIQNAFAAEELFMVTGNEQQKIEEIKNSYTKKNNGDIIFTLQPGWTITNQKNEIIDRVSELHPTVPLFIWGNNIKAQNAVESQSATSIAPYLCKLLKIRYPNAVLSTKAIVFE